MRKAAPTKVLWEGLAGDTRYPRTVRTVNISLMVLSVAAIQAGLASFNYQLRWSSGGNALWIGDGFAEYSFVGMASAESVPLDWRIREQSRPFSRVSLDTAIRWWIDFAPPFSHWGVSYSLFHLSVHLWYLPVLCIVRVIRRLRREEREQTE